MTRRRDPLLHQLVASTHALAARLAAVEKRLDAREGDRLRVEVLENRNRWLERRLDALDRRERRAVPRPAAELVPRISIARAAAILGTSRKQALRLAADALLDAADERLAGAPRAVVTVTAESLERLLAARAGRLGPLGHENTATAGPRPAAVSKGE